MNSQSFQKNNSSNKKLSELSALSGSNWRWVKLGEVAISEKGKKPKNLSAEKDEAFSIPYVDIKAFEKRGIDNYTDGDNCRFCEPDDVLIVWDGARCGLVGRGVKGAIGSTLAKIKSKQLINTFLFYFLQQHYKLINLKPKGVGIPHIDPNLFWNLVIPLPPLPVQQKIVEKIEELFSELDSGVANLRKAKEQIKTYRQSVLAFAFAGKLTQELRMENGELKIEKDNSQFAISNSQLPNGWKWVKFIDFCKLQRGYDLPLKNIVKGKYPVVTSGGINGFHNEYKASGPCLTTGRSGGVGNILFLKVEKYWPHNTVLFVKDFCNNIPEFVYYFFKQFDFKSFSASTAVPTLDRKQLYNELVKVPPLDEQEMIVSEIERRFSVADKLEQTINESLEKAEQLKQSILKKAFEGKLV